MYSSKRHFMGPAITIYGANGGPARLYPAGAFREIEWRTVANQPRSFHRDAARHSGANYVAVGGDLGYREIPPDVDSRS